MTQYGTWVSYGGAARVGLALVLLAAAAGLAHAGTPLLEIRLDQVVTLKYLRAYLTPKTPST